MNSIYRKSVLSVAGLMVVGGTVAGLETAADAARVDNPDVEAPADSNPDVGAPADSNPDLGAPADSNPDVGPPPEPPGERVLEHAYQRQPNSYFCAPAATRIALSTQGKVLSQKEIANKLGTTRAGTASANDTTRVLNEVTGGGYETTQINGPEAQPEQVDKLRADVVEAIDTKRGVVANTMGTGVDVDGKRHSFPGGHYVSIVGYRDGGDTLEIADPYGRTNHYWMSDEKVATWVAERGYSS
ncbi:Peptidase_C39 like family protein [Micromonospora rhizosphaerae]|uniref:Peptidase_C39 like family protein n=1 Tax=Micromonospora rhizosphaerae TaxID=568872 RepID=A0A1C6SE23_9ACTN|nr:C39 family peptidase [Micromonospora rhizosphaerae]SCL27722.1 Peptidase_C39 like family protein [Micromonospora rhizosphaerae]